jgi:hypothetical protein
MFGVLMGMSLACSGASENLFTWSTGAEIDQDGKNVSIEMPGGTRIKTEVGRALPDDFPLPPPWEDATPETYTESFHPDGSVDVTVTYTMKRPREEIMGRYATWMKKQPGKFMEDERRPIPGLVVHSLILKQDLKDLVVNVMQGYGLSSLSILYIDNSTDERAVESKKARSSD